QAFATIGEGARLGGQVALAVACARHLAELGSVRGPELVDRIIETYADAPARRTSADEASPEHRAPARGSGISERGTRGIESPGRPNEIRPPRATTLPPRSHGPTDPPALPAPVDDPLADARSLLACHGEWLTSRSLRHGPPAPLLSALSPPAARALAGVMTARAFTPGTRIIDVGEPATALYWIAHGTVSVTRAASPETERPEEWTVLGELHSGAFFGEIALVGGTRRTARVTAVDDVWVLEIPARAIEAAAARQPRLAEVLAFHARARLLANLTRTSELFRALGEDDREALLARLSTELVPAGARYIEQGAPNQHLWVVVAGRCEVRAAGGAIAELGPGAAVGELSLVSG